MQIISKSLAETEKLAADFVKNLKPNDRATVVAMRGDLGSGKTTFVKAAAAVLGIKAVVQSPTFVIMKRYEIRGGEGKFKNLIHIDAYRLKNGEELKKLGFEELAAEPKNLIFIEWPENAASAVPADAAKISFEFLDEKTRKINLID